MDRLRINNILIKTIINMGMRMRNMYILNSSRKDLIRIKNNMIIIIHSKNERIIYIYLYLYAFIYTFE